MQRHLKINSQQNKPTNELSKTIFKKSDVKKPTGPVP